MFELAYQAEGPGDLSKNVRDTLKEFGFVVEYLAEDKKTTKYQYHVVNAAQGLGDFVKRPGRIITFGRPPEQIFFAKIPLRI